VNDEFEKILGYLALQRAELTKTIKAIVGLSFFGLLIPLFFVAWVAAARYIF
jgi:hypothetical protein